MKTETREKKEDIFLFQKKKIGNEHHVVVFAVLFVFFRFPHYFARFIGFSWHLFSKARNCFIIPGTVLILP